MKIRLDRNLLSRARACAEEIDAPLTDWAGRALRLYRAGKFPRVADNDAGKGATRASVVATLPGEQREADEMRQALQAAVAWCEARRLPPLQIPLVEGKDYLVEREAE